MATRPSELNETDPGTVVLPVFSIKLDEFTVELCTVSLNVAVITLSNGTSVAPLIGSVVTTGPDVSNSKRGNRAYFVAAIPKYYLAEWDCHL